MKTIDVKHIRAEQIQAGQIPALISEAGIEYNNVDSVNWYQAFPYCPHVEFALAHTGNAILLHYRVTEQSIRTTCTADNQNIWEDSCVEFFVSPEEDGTYYNIECNSLGNLLVGGGNLKPDRVRSTPEVMKAIQRSPSQPEKTAEGNLTWSLALLIPITTFFLHKVEHLSGKAMRANFYKCGDLLPTPHFLSWNPIIDTKPNFHRPDCFGLLRFE